MTAAAMWGCGSGPAGNTEPPGAHVAAALPSPAPLTSAAPATAGDDAKKPKEDALFREILARVSKARGLPVLSEVKLQTLDREAVGKRIREHAARELPPDVLAHETEALVALGLVAPSYNGEDGMFELITMSITGFYEPDDRAMYLTADLSDDERVETLVHELVHALQDQHFGLGPMLKYAPGDDERLAAGHALAEGDATAATFELAAGEQATPDEARFAVRARRAIEAIAPEVPAVLRESLVAPYVDGFAFVQGLRRRGGFAAVDAAWKAPPQTTEQVLHLDKYDAKEAPVAVAAPSLAPLTRAKDGRTWKEAYSQVIGEQGLRIVLEAWTDREAATKAAAGWGGDRYVLAAGEGKAAGETALAWHVSFDTEADAKEMAAVLRAQAHGTCVARPDVGPFAWAHKKREVALVMGPYRRADGKASSTGTCKEALAWVSAIVAGGSK
ncbi:MAG: DUF6782 family putative metallopeptidase [Polyangiaceae bacterium]